MDTIEFFSEIIISLSFNTSVASRAVTAEYAVYEAQPLAVRRGIRKPKRGNETVLKLCALCVLRGDKSLDF
jgi:hypothetical protein